jgi:hypothetical protein
VITEEPRTPKLAKAPNRSVTHSANQCVGEENVPWRPKKFVSRRPNSDVLSRGQRIGNHRRRTALERLWRRGGRGSGWVRCRPSGPCLGLFCGQPRRRVSIDLLSANRRRDGLGSYRRYAATRHKGFRNHLDGALIIFLGVDPPDAADHAGAELFLDATHGRRITVGLLKLSKASPRPVGRMGGGLRSACTEAAYSGLRRFLATGHGGRRSALLDVPLFGLSSPII